MILLCNKKLVTELENTRISTLIFTKITIRVFENSISTKWTVIPFLLYPTWAPLSMSSFTSPVWLTFTASISGVDNTTFSPPFVIWIKFTIQHFLPAPVLLWHHYDLWFIKQVVEVWIYFRPWPYLELALVDVSARVKQRLHSILPPRMTRQEQG